MSVQSSSQDGRSVGWLVSAVAGIIAAILSRWLGDSGMGAAVLVGITVFMVFGVLLGMFWGAPISSAGHDEHGHDEHGHEDHGHEGHGHGDYGHESHGDHGNSPAVRVAAPQPVAVAPVLARSVAVDAAPVRSEMAPVAPVVVEPGAAVAAFAPVQSVAPVAPMAAAVAFVPEGGQIAAPATPVAVVAEEPEVASASVVAGVAAKPVGLSGPRGGQGDDLQTLEGIGPVLEKLCHQMGIFHFDQIAAWGAGEIAWMDGNLKGFKGRVTRDKWVPQARLIGTVGLEEFKFRAKTNDY